MSQTSRGAAYILALLATIIWSGNFIVARGLNEVYSPITISTFRWLVACIVITPFAWPYIKRDLEHIMKQWKLMVGLSFLVVTLFPTLIYLAAHYTSALNLSLLAITAPFYVVIINRIVFKERLNLQQIIGFVVLAVGLVLLISKGDLSLLTNLDLNSGDLLMALAALIFGIYSAFVRKKNPNIGNLSFVAATFILGELMLLPIFLTEQFVIKPELQFTDVAVSQLLYIGIGPSVISFYLWNRSIVTIGSTKAATIYNTLPIFSATFAALILSEEIMLIQVISSIIIIGGVMMVILGGKFKLIR